MTTSDKPFDRKLSEGLLGGRMVDYFLLNGEAPPITAVMVENLGKDSVLYQMTLEDGRVEDYIVNFKPNTFLIIDTIVFAGNVDRDSQDSGDEE